MKQWFEKFFTNLRNTFDAMAHPVRSIKRFQKRNLMHATLECAPGAAMLDITRDGRLIGRLILKEVTMDSRDGASATFVDCSHYLRERTIFGRIDERR